MIRLFFSLVFCFCLFFSSCYAEGQENKPGGQPVSSVVTLKNFTSAVVVVNHGNGNALSKEAELFSDELKQLGITPIPEGIAWELYQLTKKNSDVTRYRYYLADAYDTVAQADVFPLDKLFRVRFTLVSLKDPGMPILFTKEIEATGNQEEALHAAFSSFVQELIGLRSGIMTDNTVAVDVNKKQS